VAPAIRIAAKEFAMPEIGLFLSCEEQPGSLLVDFARAGEEAGFRSVLISDHFHPWLDSQGQSPFVWNVLGAIAATTDLRLTTGVTCPTVRMHPAIVAHAAASLAELSSDRFRLGVGSGENLNEHILGDHWPVASVRLEMLEEAVEVMRKLWAGGIVTHHGKHYTVEDARLYTLGARPPEVIVSGFGPKAIDLAARIGDGFITVQPDADALQQYAAAGGQGPKLGALKVCWAADERSAIERVHRLWRNEEVPGELAQVLPMPAHFEQAAELVTPDMVAESIACGPDPERHVAAIKPYLEAGFDEVFINHIGDDWDNFLPFLTKEVLPRLGL
jgi:G6PDH family F420-dependent oxidoreductase